MAETDARKQQIIEELAQVRTRLAYESTQVAQKAKLLAEKANVPRHVVASLHTHSFSWVSGAALAGWVLSRLPVRKQRVMIEVGRDGQERRRKTKEVGLMSYAWKGLWALARPLITAYLSSRITARQVKNA